MSNLCYVIYKRPLTLSDSVAVDALLKRVLTMLHSVSVPGVWQCWNMVTPSSHRLRDTTYCCPKHSHPQDSPQGFNYFLNILSTLVIGASCP